jgi:hypothetical protein
VHHSTESLYKNITLNDVQLAAAYYPILVDLARHKHCLTYGELVNQAKEMYPDLEHVKNAIAVSTGRKLDVVRIFTNERELPDVTSLILNKGQGECGTGFTEHFDPEKVREDVYSFDWSDITTEFDVYIEAAVKNTVPKKRRKRPEALKLMSAFYQENKNLYPASIKDMREDIVILLMEGFTEKEAFEQVLTGDNDCI